MIVAVEGIDCAGKGEVCPLLARALGAELHKTPPEHMRAEQDRINLEATDEEHYRWFLRVIQDASASLQAIASSQNVVLDRYWMTTVVYHRTMGIPASLEDFGTIVMPDFTVFLDVNETVRERRMRDRGMSPGDRRMQGREDNLRRTYDKVLAAERAPVIRVDTSTLSPKQIVQSIMGDILNTGWC